MKHTIKQGDTKRKVKDTLMLNGVPIDLTGATVVLVIKSTATGSTAVRRTATITDADSGKVEYQFVTADVATAGDFQMEWEVTFTDATKLTIPQDEYILLTILPELG